MCAREVVPHARKKSFGPSANRATKLVYNRESINTTAPMGRRLVKIYPHTYVSIYNVDHA